MLSPSIIARFKTWEFVPTSEEGTLIDRLLPVLGNNGTVVFFVVVLMIGIAVTVSGSVVEGCESCSVKVESSKSMGGGRGEGGGDVSKVAIC